jgi:hypothetical protein
MRRRQHELSRTVYTIFVWLDIKRSASTAESWLQGVEISTLRRFSGDRVCDVVSKSCHHKHQGNVASESAMDCPGHLTYEPFAAPCTSTCVELPGTPCPLSAVWEEDCVCGKGEVNHKDKCVKPKDCGCDYPQLGFIKVSCLKLSHNIPCDLIA